nr:ribonuclease H-like domain-containing protein [Tanacetum cinerariifolium]
MQYILSAAETLAVLWSSHCKEKFPLPGEVPTASEESSHCKKKRDATAEKIALLLKTSSNCQSKSYDSYANKHKIAQELWAAILNTLGGNEATKKIKKNLLKQQYSNFKAEGSKTLEQTFNRLQRNKSDLNTMSQDDLYNHLKVYESKVQKKSESNLQNMAFISSAKHSSRNEKVNTASVSTASTNVSTASADIGAANDMEEMDIKWNMAPLSMRANRYWKKTGKKITIQGTDVARFDKLKTPKDLMVTDGVGWDWSYMANDEENHALVADEEAPIEFALMAKTSAESEELDIIKKEKEGLHSKLVSVQTASKDLDILLESQRLDKNKEGLGYSAVHPPLAQVYSPPKKDLSWTGLLEFADDIVTDYSRPASTIESYPDDAQNRNPSITKTEVSPSTILPKPFIKFGKATDRSTETKTAKLETAKPAIKFATMYNKPSKSSKVSGNQRNWNNLKSYQLGKNFVMNKRACYNCGDFDHLAYDCCKWVDHGRSWAKNNNTHKTYSYNKRPFQRTSAVRSQFRDPRLPTVNRKFPTSNTKFSTADMGNISYLSDYEPFDEGYVSFRQGGCKITGKGTIKN